MNPLNQIIIALDGLDDSELEDLLPRIAPHFSWVKVGMELFYSKGPSILEHIHRQGFQIFLDLKLYDIPQTVYNALKQISKLPVSMMNVHLSGGEKMLAAARQAISSSQKLIGVSVLTSFDQAQWQKAYQTQRSLDQYLQYCFELAEKHQLDGVVCSAQDLKLLNKNLISICPGIRLSAPAHDQERIATPMQAFKQSADFLVMGREVTQNENLELWIQKLQEHLNDFSLS